MYCSGGPRVSLQRNKVVSNSTPFFAISHWDDACSVSLLVDCPTIQVEQGTSWAVMINGTVFSFPFPFPGIYLWVFQVATR